MQVYIYNFYNDCKITIRKEYTIQHRTVVVAAKTHLDNAYMKNETTLP